MLPTTGYFRGVPCPDHEKGLCARPFCHFRHNPKTEDYGSLKESQAEKSSGVIEDGDEPFEEEAPNETPKNEESAAKNCNPHGNSLLDGSKSTILQQLVSEAVHKIITENPILAGIDPSTLIHKLDTKTLLSDAKNQIHNAEDSDSAPLGSSNSTNTEEVGSSCSTPKKQRLYLPPPGTPRYDPTPISELKKRKNSVPENDQEETSNESKRLKTSEDSDGTDFSIEDDEDALKRKSEFDLLEEVLAEHSMSRKRSTRTKRKKAISKPEYNINKKPDNNVNEAEMIADARTSKNDVSKDSSLSSSRASPEVDHWEPPSNSFLPPSPVFTSSSDAFNDFSSLQYVSLSSTNAMTGETSGRTTHQKLEATTSQNGPDDNMSSETDKQKRLSTVEATAGKKTLNLPENTVTPKKNKFSGPKLLRREFPLSPPKLVRPNTKVWNPHSQVSSGPNINTENLEALLQDSGRDKNDSNRKDLDKDKPSSSEPVNDGSKQGKTHKVGSKSDAFQLDTYCEDSDHRSVREKVNPNSLERTKDEVNISCSLKLKPESNSVSSKSVRQERNLDSISVEEKRKGDCLNGDKKDKDCADSRNIKEERSSISPEITKEKNTSCTINSRIEEATLKSKYKEDCDTESEPEADHQQSRVDADEKTGPKEKEKSTKEAKTGTKKEGYESQAYEESEEETEMDLPSSGETRKHKKRRRRRRSIESYDSSDSYYVQKRRRQKKKQRKKHSRKKRRHKDNRSDSEYSSSESDSEDEETSSEEESDGTRKARKRRKKSRHHRKSRHKNKKNRSKYKKRKRRRSQSTTSSSSSDSSSTSSSSSSSSGYRKRKKKKRKELQRHTSDSISGSSDIDDKASKNTSKHSIEMPVSPSEIKVEKPDLSIVKVEKIDPGYEIHEKMGESNTPKICDSIKEKHQNKSKVDKKSERQISKEKNYHDKRKTEERQIPKEKSSHINFKTENKHILKYSNRVHGHKSHKNGEPDNAHPSTSHHRTKEEKQRTDEKHIREKTKDKGTHKFEQTSSQDDNKRSYSEDRKKYGKKQRVEIEKKEESRSSSKRQEITDGSCDPNKKKISDEGKDSLDSVMYERKACKGIHSSKQSENKTKVKKECEFQSEASQLLSQRQSSEEDEDSGAMSLFDSLMLSMGGTNQKGTVPNRKTSSTSQDKGNSKHINTKSKSSHKHRKDNSSVLNTKPKDEVKKEDKNTKTDGERKKERRSSSSSKSSDRRNKSSKTNMDAGGDSPDLSALDLIPQEDWDLLLQECKEEPDEKKSDDEAPMCNMEYESDDQNDDEGFDCSHDEEEIEESLKKSKAYQKLMRELADGRRRLKELEEQQKKLDVKEAPTSLFAASAFRSSNSEQGNAARRRVASVPNVASLLHAREKIKSLPPTSSCSLLSPKVALPSGVLPSSTHASSSKAGPIASSSIDQVKALATNRTSLIAKEEVRNRPSIPVEIGSKIPHNIRQRYLTAFIEECLKFCCTPEDAYNIAVAEESVCYQRGTNRMIYLNVAVNTVKRLRLEQISEGAQEILEEDPEVASGLCSSQPAESSQSSVATKFPVTSTKKRVARKNSSPASSTSTSVCGQSSIQRKESHFSIMAGGGMKGSWSVPASSKPSSRSVNSEYEGVTFYKHLKKYILNDEDMEVNGFPYPDLSVKGKARIIKVNPRKKITPSPLKRYCARCSTIFPVDDLGFPTPLLSCVYHWGRLLKRSGTSNFDAEYTCCQGGPHSEGCCQAVAHVSDNFNPEELHGFARTIPKDPGPDGNYGIFALDCETCFTTGGKELVKVSVMSDAGSIVYETLVQPDNPVLDYNTRFTGLTEEELAGVQTTTKDVQNVLLARFSEKTILIGHNLESDLCTIKLIHKTIIDTSLVFPHKKGPPHKRALPHLAAEYLRRIIEEGEGGHDTADNALACLDLMKWKVREDLKCKVKK